MLGSYRVAAHLVASHVVLCVTEFVINVFHVAHSFIEEFFSCLVAPTCDNDRQVFLVM
jgi:hypothetical protein